MYQEVLEKLGLTKTQSIVYYALLELGPSSIQAILKRIPSIKRGNLYNVLKTLRELGLTAEQQVNSKSTVFRTLSPHKLEKLLETEERDLSVKKSSLDNIRPALESLFVTSTEKPGIQYLEGAEGVVKSYEDILRCTKGELLVFHGAFTDEEAVGTQYYKKYLKQKAEKGISTKVILRDTPAFHHLSQYDSKHKIYRKFVDSKKFKLPADIGIYGDKATIIEINGKEGKKIGFIVENKNFAESMRNIFNFMWEMC